MLRNMQQGNPLHHLCHICVFDMRDVAWFKNHLIREGDVLGRQPCLIFAARATNQTSDGHSFPHSTVVSACVLCNFCDNCCFLYVGGSPFGGAFVLVLRRSFELVLLERSRTVVRSKSV